MVQYLSRHRNSATLISLLTLINHCVNYRLSFASFTIPAFLTYTFCKTPLPPAIQALHHVLLSTPLSVEITGWSIAIDQRTPPVPTLVDGMKILTGLKNMSTKPVPVTTVMRPFWNTAIVRVSQAIFFSSCAVSLSALYHYLFPFWRSSLFKFRIISPFPFIVQGRPIISTSSL